MSADDNKPGPGRTLDGRLAEPLEPSSYIPVPNASPTEQETAIRHITFWRDGFSIEDGELMRYDDPINAQFLAEINSGRAPPSILNVNPGQPVELRVANRTNEDYRRRGIVKAQLAVESLSRPPLTYI